MPIERILKAYPGLDAEKIELARIYAEANLARGRPKSTPSRTSEPICAATDSPILLLSHGSDDPHRPSAEFSYYVEGARRDDRKAYVLFTGKPCAERVADFRSDVHRPVGPSATHGDVRLNYTGEAWVVEKHAVDVPEKEDVGQGS